MTALANARSNADDHRDTLYRPDRTRQGNTDTDGVGHGALRTEDLIRRILGRNSHMAEGERSPVHVGIDNHRRWGSIRIV